MKAYWSAKQIQGGRDYQEDFFATVAQNSIHYNGKKYPLELGVLPEEHILFVIADGMGGMGHGDLAASLVVERFIESYLNTFLEQKMIEASFLSGVHAANDAISGEVSKNSSYSGMGATLIALLWDATESCIYWVSVGDSLLLSCSNYAQTIEKLNAKHTWKEQAQSLRDSGENLSDEKLEKIGDALCSAIDGSKLEFIDVQAEGVKLSEGDLIVIASDGLETLTDRDIGNILSAARKSLVGIQDIEKNNKQMDICVENLLNQVSKQGSSSQDNTTVMLLGVFNEPDIKRINTRIIPENTVANSIESSLSNTTKFLVCLLILVASCAIYFWLSSDFILFGALDSEVSNVMNSNSKSGLS